MPKLLLPRTIRSTVNSSEVPIEMEMGIQKSYECQGEELEKGVKNGDWVVEGFASRVGVDHHGDEITLDAMEYAEESLRKNTTVLFNHDQFQPIGKLIEVRTDRKNGGLYTRSIISKSEPGIWAKIEDGTLNKFSIYGRILESDRVKRSDGYDGRVIKKMYLHEISIVSVPGNSDAEVTSIHKSLSESLSIRPLCLYCDTPLQKGYRLGDADGVLQNFLSEESQCYKCEKCDSLYKTDGILYNEDNTKAYAMPMDSDKSTEIAEMEEIMKAKWSTAYKNSLPNKSFAAIEPAYTKGDTKDKNARHLPFRDKEGKLDPPHYRNARARQNQIEPITDSITTEALRAKAKKTLDAAQSEYDKAVGKKCLRNLEQIEKGVWPKSIKGYLMSPDQYDSYYGEYVSPNEDKVSEYLTPEQYRAYYEEYVQKCEIMPDSVIPYLMLPEQYESYYENNVSGSGNEADYMTPEQYALFYADEQEMYGWYKQLQLSLKKEMENTGMDKMPMKPMNSSDDQGHMDSNKDHDDQGHKDPNHDSDDQGHMSSKSEDEESKDKSEKVEGGLQEEGSVSKSDVNEDEKEVLENMESVLAALQAQTDAIKDLAAAVKAGNAVAQPQEKKEEVAVQDVEVEKSEVKNPDVEGEKEMAGAMKQLTAVLQELSPSLRKSPPPGLGDERKIEKLQDEYEKSKASQKLRFLASRAFRKGEFDFLGKPEIKV